MKLKKLVSAFCAACILLTALPNSFAVDHINNGPWKSAINSEGDPYLFNVETGEEVVAAYRASDSGLIEFDLTEYLDILNSVAASSHQPESKNISSFNYEDNGPRISSVYDYVETKQTTITGPEQKVSPDLRGPGTISVSETVTISHSFGGSISATATMKSAIQAGASFTWNISATSSKNYTLTKEVPAGKVGYMVFIPYLNKTEGDLYQVKWSTGPEIERTFQGHVWGTSPKKLATGAADGYVDIRFK